jgi:hypothetical protein
MADSGSVLLAFRAVRLLRLFKLAKSWSTFRRLLSTIRKTLLDIGYFSLLLLIILFIYTLIGMELFAYRIQFGSEQEVEEGGESPRQNFDDFLHAFTTVWTIIVGDDWQLAMFDAVRTQGYTSTVYFISLIIIGHIILLNLFLVILVNNFETTEIKKERLEAGRTKKKRKTYKMISTSRPKFHT